ncbi:amidohydrolase family protein [Roseivirga seohaensis]|uniref:amidohydrolase family protein n=1 Tax=Roseivirga seohaensis TaxID=1914963 RepID=UPI0009E7A10E|nr:amidohydrolase family protein [Roseivirga seohaensis]
MINKIKVNLSLRVFKLVIASLIYTHAIPQTPYSTFFQRSTNKNPDSLQVAQPYIEYNVEVIALTNATVIDGTGRSIRKNQTLIIKNGLFQEFGNNVEVPQNALVIDVTDKTIIPGIVGMHNHLHIPQFPNVGHEASKLYLASGVTTIQTCGAASPEHEIILAKKITQGELMGPEIIPSAPFITGTGGNPNMIIPRNEQHLRDTMQYWINQGVEWFKVYRNTNPNDLRIIIDEAHKNKAKVRGHLCSITFEEATKLGIDGIEHGLNSTSDFRSNKSYGICNGSTEYLDELIIDSPKVKELHQLMIDNQVFLTSTLAIYEASVPNRAFADERSLKIMSPYLQSQYRERRKGFDQETKNLTRENRLKRIMAFEYQYFKMGGLLCSGVDAGRHVLPGLGDQRNYQLLIEAGFTTEEAIQVMTSNGAKALGRSDIGLIQPGKRADFVILNGDLKTNDGVIERVETVFKNGIGYNSEKILSEMNGKFGID